MTELWGAKREGESGFVPQGKYPLGALNSLAPELFDNEKFEISEQVLSRAPKL